MKINTQFVAINEFIIYLLITSTVLSLSVSACSVDMCSREYSSVLSVSQQQWTADMSSSESGQQYCALLNAYQHCLRSISRSCRGNLEFHTLQTLLKNWKNEHNCSHSSNHAIKTIVPPIHRKAIPSLVSQTNTQWRQQNEDKNIELQEKLQTCLSSAYNYTINGNHSSNAPIDERTRLLNEQNIKAYKRSKNRGRRHRRRRDVGSKFVPISGETVDLDEDIDKNEFDSNTMPSTVPSVKPLMPPSPPLTCIIYGDPHLRTFDNLYQTCRCLGAWPLLDHPLFAVQITNSRIKGESPQITGVSKVTVLVRQFTKCGIRNDLLYEADSQSSQGSTTPSSTFIDGSTSNSNNLIRITQSSNNNVITIHLDHIGVRVYIGQFENSYLNVVIKFRSATSTVKQQLVLNSISSNSLCKIGCPKREQIDIENIVRATGIDMSANTANSAQNSDNSVVNNNNEFKSDSSVIDANDDPNEEESESDPCHDLWGYYRISCLYDQTIKGIKHVNNANRFAQSFDEKKFISNSIQNNSVQDINHLTQPSINSSPKLPLNHCLNICLFFVIYVIKVLL